MRLTVDQKILTEALAAAQSIAGRAAVIPILANVLLEAVDETTLRVTATDLDTTLIRLVPAAISSGGAIAVAARKFHEIVRLLPRGELSVATGAKNGPARIESGKSSFLIAANQPDSYPDLSGQNRAAPARHARLPAPLLGSLIKHTNFAMTDQSSRFTLAGAKFELRGRTARMVTTDGHRLALIEARLDREAPGEIDVIVPRKALSELLKLCTDEVGGEVLFWDDANHLYFELAGARLVSRRLTGAFPNYETVIPTDNDLRAVFEAREMLAALNRVSLMADDRTRAVKLIVRPRQMEITAGSSDEGDASETIDIEEYAGKEIAIKFQHEYVRDLIRSFAGESDSRIAMTFRGEHAQTLFFPTPDGAPADRLLGVIMPLVH